MRPKTLRWAREVRLRLPPKLWKRDLPGPPAPGEGAGAKRHSPDGSAGPLPFKYIDQNDIYIYIYNSEAVLSPQRDSTLALGAIKNHDRNKSIPFVTWVPHVIGPPPAPWTPPIGRARGGAQPCLNHKLATESCCVHRCCLLLRLLLPFPIPYHSHYPTTPIICGIYIYIYIQLFYYNLVYIYI